MYLMLGNTSCDTCKQHLELFLCSMYRSSIAYPRLLLVVCSSIRCRYRHHKFLQLLRREFEVYLRLAEEHQAHLYKYPDLQLRKVLFQL